MMTVSALVIDDQEECPAEVSLVKARCTTANSTETNSLVPKSAHAETLTTKTNDGGARLQK